MVVQEHRSRIRKNQSGIQKNIEFPPLLLFCQSCHRCFLGRLLPHNHALMCDF